MINDVLLFMSIAMLNFTFVRVFKRGPHQEVEKINRVSELTYLKI